MNTKDLKSINNLSLRYQDYDHAGTKYAYDIRYTTTHSEGEYMKAKRERGADKFNQHIKDLSEKYEGVATITVADYSGKAQNARMINPPVTIVLIDLQANERTPKAPIPQNGHFEQATHPDFGVLQGLNGLYAGTEFAGLGNLAPIAKFIDDKHTIDNLRKENGEQALRMAEMKRENKELSEKYQALSLEYEQLQDEAADMDEELAQYRNRNKKQDDVMNMIGLAGAKFAKNFLLQNPNFLSGIIPAEQLSGILSGETEVTETVSVNELSAEEQARMDKATAMFEWTQTLENPIFEEVFKIMCIIQQKPAYAAHIIRSLSNNKGDKEK